MSSPADTNPPPERAANGAAPASPSPRAFAQGTGVLLQMVGMTLFLASCCICSVSGWWDPPMGRHETQEKLDNKQIQPELPRRPFSDAATTGLSLTVIATTIGGLALAVFGLGLQSDKPRAGWAATVTCLLWLIVLVIAAICLWTGGASLVSILWNHALILAALILCAFSVAALRQVLRHPPPPGLEILPPDFEPPRFRH